ncbi:sugar porter family MFS transporter [Thiorhodovibrio frisius]|uniref:MFS transporter, sugar porter family n=1 Tax=Thiorhodovibrio frisius TaxID=631362 RepID=H8YXA1_9GAMM|nr:sugar porter family MFS transporter [Thiorhodovibrio frisius]EIC23077.1 MFS transporter, sugar porter family [Thiorhodovibrio frisius]WPL22658.1 putative metabolite transport protein CsbC [Thiorhodovibrio frisius]
MTRLSSLVALVAALSGLLVGYATGVIAGAEAPLTKEFGLQDQNALRGLLVGCILIGGFFGAIFAGAIVKHIGPRRMLILIGVVFAVASFGMSYSEHAWPFIAWRTLAGFAVGASTMVAPLYVGETAPPNWRGALITGFQLALTMGILLGYLANLAFAETENWRLMLGLMAVPSLILVVGMIPLTESPRWLLLRGHKEVAQRVFRRIAGFDWPPQEMAQVLASGQLEADWRDLLRPRFRPVLLVAVLLFAFTNLSGIDVILYYAPVIFAEVGFDGTLGPILATVGIGTINVLATIAAMWMVDRYGRRPLLIGGLIPMAIAMAMMVPSLLFEGAGWNAMALVALALFIVSFAISLGPLPYVIMAEIFPVQTRGVGMGLAAAAAWAVNALVSVSFFSLAATFGMPSVFGMFALICVIALIFVVIYVPETRGRSLEEIEANLVAGKPVRRLGEVFD